MYNFDLILEDIVDWFERNLSLIPTEGWFNFTYKAFLKGSLFALPAWFMYIASIVCVLRYILIFVTNWAKWFLHKPKSQPVDRKPDSDDPAFTVRLEVLKGKASRVSAKIWKELEDMEKGGMSSPKSEGYETYNKNLALVSRYDEFIEAKPETYSALEYLEWSFNEGALRTEEEIKEHEVEVERDLYLKSGQYQLERELVEDAFKNKRTLTACVIIPVILSTVLLICCTGEYSTITLKTWFLGIPLLAPGMVLLFLSLFFVSVTFEKSFYKLAKKAGKLYLPHIETLMDAAGLGIALSAIGNIFSTKKRR